MALIDFNIWLAFHKWFSKKKPLIIAISKYSTHCFYTLFVLNSKLTIRVPIYFSILKSLSYCILVWFLFISLVHLEVIHIVKWQPWLCWYKFWLTESINPKCVSSLKYGLLIFPVGVDDVKSFQPIHTWNKKSNESNFYFNQTLIA